MVHTVGLLAKLLYLLDQMPLSISCCSRIVTAPPEVLNKVVAAFHATPTIRVMRAHVNVPRARSRWLVQEK